MNKKYYKIILSFILSALITSILSALMGNYVILSFTVFIIHFLIFFLCTRKPERYLQIKHIIPLAIFSLLIILATLPIISYTKILLGVTSGIIGIILGINTALKSKKTDMQILLTSSNIIGVMLFFGSGYLVYESFQSSYCMASICEILAFMGFGVALLPMILSFYSWHYYNKENGSIARLGFIFGILPYIASLFIGIIIL